jgi:colicin import membrane protein
LTGGRTDLEAVLVIKIMPNGEIQDIWFEKKSGNSYFDDSVYKAVKKSNPLPPLPKDYQRPFYNVGLVFTPSGLRKGMG